MSKHTVEVVRDSKGVACWRIGKPFQRGEIWYGRAVNLESGEATKIATGETVRAKAQQRLRDWCADEIRKAAIQANDDATRTTEKGFKDAYTEFLDVVKAGVRPVTRKTYDQDRDLYSRSFEGLFVHEIGVAEIEQFLANLAKDKKAARTRRKHLGSLRAFFQWAIRRKYIGSDPTADLKVAKGSKHSQPALSLEGARRLLEASTTPIVRTTKGVDGKNYKRTFTPPQYLFAAILLGLHTGLRRSNIFGLRWRDVDLAAGKITIPADRMKAGEALQLPIHPELGAFLRKALRDLHKVPKDEPVVGALRREVRDAFEAVATRAGAMTPEGRPIGWHALRKTFATLYGVRVPHATLQHLLGHAAKDMTDLYTRVPFEELKKAVEALPCFLPAAGAGVKASCSRTPS